MAWVETLGKYHLCIFHKKKDEKFDEEMKALEREKTWELVDLQNRKKVVGLKWISKIKLQANSSIQNYKARLVACSYMQRERIEFQETFSLITRFDNIMLILSIVAHFNWKVYQFDLKLTLKEKMKRFQKKCMSNN